MNWIKSSEQLPKNDQWCWIFAHGNWTERACYDAVLEKWVISEGVHVLGSNAVSHWQPYFVPAPPYAYDTTKIVVDDDV